MLSFGCRGGLLYDVSLSGSAEKRKGRQAVRDQVDREQLDGQQRDRETHQGRKEKGPYFARIRRQQVLDEFSDIVKDLLPSPTAFTIVAKLSSSRIMWLPLLKHPFP